MVYSHLSQRQWGRLQIPALTMSRGLHRDGLSILEMDADGLKRTWLVGFERQHVVRTGFNYLFSNEPLGSHGINGDDDSL